MVPKIIDIRAPNSRPKPWNSLERYKLLLRRPGRYLDGDAMCSPGLEPEDGRDLIASVLARLPRGARRDLEHLIAPLDK